MKKALGLLVLILMCRTYLAAADILALAGGADLEAVRAALHSGADANARGPAGRTPLMVASMSSANPLIAAELLKAGARVDQRDGEGFTALMLAARSTKTPEMVIDLLSAGADANLRSDEGKTAWDYASRNKSLAGSAALAALQKATEGAKAGQASSVLPSPSSILLEDLEQDSERGSAYSQGWAVGSSSDASLFAVGMPYFREKGSPKSRGQVRLFGPDGRALRLLFIEDTENRLFGSAIAIAADGSAVAVGTPGRNSQDPGMITLFPRPAEGWDRGNPDQGSAGYSISDEAGSLCGFSLALSDRTLVFGLPGKDGHGRVQYLLAPSGGWGGFDLSVAGKARLGILGIGNPKPGIEFGRSVAISKDDAIIAIGAPGYDGNRGAVFVFRKPPQGWFYTETVVDIIPPQGNPGDRFGESVALSADGSVLAVGVDGWKGGRGAVAAVSPLPLPKSSDSRVNMVYLEDRVQGRRLGLSVAISEDGTTIAAGSLGAGKDGMVRIWKNAWGSWSYFGKRGAGGLFGYGIALSGNGKKLLAGSPLYMNGEGGFQWLSSDLH